MLPTTCFQNEERWRSAKRCAANSHRKTGAPPAPRPPRPLPSHHTHQSTIFVVPVLWQHECAHGCSSCEYSLWNILAFGRPSYSYCRVRSVLELLHGEPFIGTLCSSIFGTSVGQTDKRTMSVVSVSVRGIPDWNGESGILSGAKNARSGSDGLCATKAPTGFLYRLFAIAVRIVKSWEISFSCLPFAFAFFANY
jgi:hypothetical protein